MRKNELAKSMSLTFNKVGFQLQKGSPGILVATGVVGAMVSIAMVCQTIPRALKVAEEAGDDMDRTQNAKESGVTSTGELCTREDARNDRVQVYFHTGFQYVKLYTLAVLLGVASTTCILTSHKVPRKRNIALAAAYAMLDQSFKNYHGRILGRFDEQVEKELRYSLKAKEVEITVMDEKGKEKKVKETINAVDEDWNPFEYSSYTRASDEGHPAYIKSAEQNWFCLLTRQSQANDRLKSRGHLFLDEVYEMLGFLLAKANAVVGRIYDDKESMGDNFMDFDTFGVCREGTVDFVNGHERPFVLDSDVVGNITDALTTHQTL